MSDTKGPSDQPVSFTDVFGDAAGPAQPAAQPGGGTPAPAPIEFRQAVDVSRIRKSFDELKKGIKKMLFSRHREEEHLSYIQPSFDLLNSFLEEHGRAELRLEVSTLVAGHETVLEDDQKDNNLVFPLWNEGVRLLTIHRGLTVEDWFRFIDILIEFTPRDEEDDVLNALWKAEIEGIEWVALSEFNIVESDGDEDEDEDGPDFELEVEDVLHYLQDRLMSETGEGVSAARLSLSDLELSLDNVAQHRTTTINSALTTLEDQATLQEIARRDDVRVLERACTVALQVLELEANADQLSDVIATLEQIVDGLVLQGRLDLINRLLKVSEENMMRPGAPPSIRELGRRANERLIEFIQEPERIRALSAALNAGRRVLPDDLSAYLKQLGPQSTVIILDILDSLTSPVHRRAFADALIVLGANAVPLFAKRLETASANLAKELYYILDGINPPNRTELLEPALFHDNAALRMAVLNTIENHLDEAAFEVLVRVFKEHKVPQMRGHAARLIGKYPGVKASPILIGAIDDEDFESRPEPERRAIISSLVTQDSYAAQNWIDSAIEKKSQLIGGRGIDDRKLMIIKALALDPGIPNLQFLSNIAKDSKLHSKDVLEAARAAAIKMKDQLMGGAT